MADWYIFIDGQARGPGSTDQLIAHLREHDPATTHIWRQGFGDWMLAGDVPEIAAALAELPAAVAGAPETTGVAGAPASVPSVPQSVSGADLAASASKPETEAQRPPRSRARRWAKYGALAGLAYGLLQIAPGRAHSSDPAYLTGFIGAGVAIGAIIAAIVGFVVDLVRRPTGIAAPSAPLSGGNFIVRHWRGELRLWVSYWIIAFVGNLAAAVVIGIIVAIVRLKGGFYPPGIFLAFLAMWSCAFVITVWQFVGVWRSAWRYKQEHKEAGRWRFWGYVAQVMCVIGVISAVATFARQGGPQLAETYKMAFANDPDIPDYSVEVTRNGSQADIVGGFKYGLTDELIKVLDANPIKIVHLDSIGGRLGEAQRVFELIRARGLSTYVSARCMSACTLAFAGGRERYLRKGATLGFHRGTFPGVEEREFDDVQAKVFRQAGFDSKFIETALSTPNTNMWRPSEDALVKAHVVTRIGTP